MENQIERNIFLMYRNYAISNDFIPSDKCLAFWKGEGISDITITVLRNSLSKEGFRFEECENGWKVVKRPLLGIDFKSFTEEQEIIIGRIVSDAVFKITGENWRVDENGFLKKEKTK